jgi:single-strand DNA-binding protein
MRSINKVVLLGHVTRDAEFKQLESGKTVCTFGLATNRLWNVENGEKHEDTEFHRIVAWDNWAKLCQKYMHKGRLVYLEGRLHTRRYAGKDGTEKTVTEIVLEDLLFLDSKPEDAKATWEVKDASNGAPVQKV